MKIQIDLEDILGDEYGSETLQESIKRQVVEQVANEIKKETKQSVTNAVDNAIKDQVADSLKSIVESGLDEQYTVVDSYGEKGPKTTIREKIREIVKSLIEYKKTSYSSDKNKFTEAVDAAIKDVVIESTKEIRKSVDYEFKKKVLSDAVDHIKSQLNLK